MGIKCFEGRYVVTYYRRGINMSFSCTNLEQAQAKLKEMCDETIVELTHKRIYYQSDKVLIINWPTYVK